MCEQTVPGAAPDGGDALRQTDRGNLRWEIEPGGPEEPPTFVIAPLPVNLGAFVY